MLSKVQKRKKIDSHDLQSLRNVVKKGEETVIKDFKDKFQEVIVEGKIKRHLLSITLSCLLEIKIYTLKIPMKSYKLYTW